MRSHDSEADRKGLFAPVWQTGSHSKGEHYEHSHESAGDPLQRCCRNCARLFQPTHGSFELGFNAHPCCSRHFAWRVSVTADRCVTFTIRQPHAGRRLRDEPGAVLRHVCGQRSVADRGPIPAPDERPNRVRPWPSGLSRRTMVGGREWEWCSGFGRSLLPVSAAPARPAHAVAPALARRDTRAE